MNNTFNTTTPFARSLYVMLKPIGAACNLRCDYCYYLEKKEMYPEDSRYTMSDELLENFTKQYLESQTQAEVVFTWHGGEALMRNKSFYERALKLQKQYSRGHRIMNTLQTNGTLLTDDWCRFFKDNEFLIGLSLDGPQHCHDRYRRGLNNEPSFYRVMKGLELLKKHDVEFNALAVVNDYNVDYALEFYNFFKSIACKFIQFTPIVEQIDGQMAAWNVPAAKWGDFLITIFDEWVKQDVGEYFVQYFDSTLANWVGVSPGVCTLAKECGHAGVMEFNGDVFSCDHFVFPQFKLGNLHHDNLSSMMYSDTQLSFGADKYRSLPQQCMDCEVHFACRGECPKNRIIKTTTGEDGLNYLCEGYYKFYKHVVPYMDFMKNELENERSPGHIMEAIGQGKLK